jgi:diacylglycerol kinase family enzyme
MLAIINPTAGGGKALDKWARIEPSLREAVGPISVFVSQSRQHLEAAMPKMLAVGHRDFLAAGGDGTVNGVLSAIVDNAGDDLLRKIRVGAIGLGSSNDFHKPFRTCIEKVPCRIDFSMVRPHDICVLDYQDSQGGDASRYWFVNASVGIAADANDFFNHPDGLLRFLKRSSTSLAIGYAALRAIFANRPRDLHLTVNGHDVDPEKVRNLGFVKNPHFAGSLRYDSPHHPVSGFFHVHRLGALTRGGLLRALARLARGRFAGGQATRSWPALRATVRNGGDPFLVECDGEVVQAQVARFGIHPRTVRLCS